MNLLHQVYNELGLEQGQLFKTSSDRNQYSEKDWVEKGEWLSLGARVQAERIFFVENNPVIVFTQAASGDPQELIKAYNNAWCMSRPRLLFLSWPGELAIFDLSKPPIRDTKEWRARKSLALIKNATEISKKLKKFKRSEIESGYLFEEKRFGGLNNRADKALIRDLKLVRRELIELDLDGENLKHAHALIGRSIFIRYLEDRGVLTPDYFLEVASENQEWLDIVKNDSSQLRPGSQIYESEQIYPKILSNKELTYAVYSKLSQDFNGDMFPDVNDEYAVVQPKHLKLIQDLLYGDTGDQKKLFFYAYDFKIIPIDLISSIYEEFYHSKYKEKTKSKAVKNGAYYTPPSLVEFVISKLIDQKTLADCPVVLDPACGSGIFLVETFRRIARYTAHTTNTNLTFDSLRNILKKQIRGIEVDPESATIAAFSLYLSLLHYLEPPDILKQLAEGYKLPNLVANQTFNSENHFNCILPLNAFDVESIQSSKALLENFGAESADIVVGNPPWGGPGNQAPSDIKKEHNLVMDWCEQNQKPLGDKEPSQAFIWRALELLSPNGKFGLLVSHGVLFKHSQPSISFRKKLFKEANIREIYNFSHVRKVFFQKAVSPFVIMFAQKGVNTSSVNYWSAKQTALVNKLQAVILTNSDLKPLRNIDFSNYKNWKIFLWGSYADKRFLDYLDAYPKLNDFIDRDQCGQGFKEAKNPDKPAAKLKKFNEVKTDSLTRYETLRDEDFISPPKQVHRYGIFAAYSGPRLLVKRGIQEKVLPKGQIVARFETTPFCFRNSINCLKFKSSEEWLYKLALGILWSDLARYYFFLTTANWGLWHHEIYLNELFNLPVNFDKTNKATSKIIKQVELLRSYTPSEYSLTNLDGEQPEEIRRHRNELESKLNEYVYELFTLDESEVDLIKDCLNVELDHFYSPSESFYSKPAYTNKKKTIVKNYIAAFQNKWAPYLKNGTSMQANVYCSENSKLLAIEFYITDDIEAKAIQFSSDWKVLLNELDETLKQELGSSNVYLQDSVKIVTSQSIIITKQNIAALWTKTRAREDSEATLCQRALS